MSNSTPDDAPTTTPEKQPVTRFPGDLRDWFAGMALSGMAAKYRFSEPGDMPAAAQIAFAVADAMLKERERAP